MMKVLWISDQSSSHTIKWIRSLSGAGIDVFLFGLSSCPLELYASLPNVRVSSLGLGLNVIRAEQACFKKLSYFSALPKIKRIIQDFKPDIVHAHYATSYGLLGALSGFHPYVLSVWGSDVFDFPKVSFWHRCLFKFNLTRADKILSTSHVMALETSRYTNKAIEVTPFGIDLDTFKPDLVASYFAPEDIVVGTVKALEKQYGIEYLIRAFHQVRCRHPQLPLKLLIVGGGSLQSYLKGLASNLGLDNCVVFTGRVPYDDVSKYHNMLSVSVSVSNSESFGVAIIEASACEKPVIVSSVGGLPEVVEDGVTGIVVPPRNVTATASAIERLILNEELRCKMGCAGRERVRSLYDWNSNVSQMINIYKRILAR